MSVFNLEVLPRMAQGRIWLGFVPTVSNGATARGHQDNISVVATPTSMRNLIPYLPNMSVQVNIWRTPSLPELTALGEAREAVAKAYKCSVADLLNKKHPAYKYAIPQDDVIAAQAPAKKMIEDALIKAGVMQAETPAPQPTGTRAEV